MAISFNTARTVILDNVTALATVQVPLLAAAGRVLSTPVRAPSDMPLWDNSAMDGFAVRAADCSPTNRLYIHGYIPAGAVPEGPVVAGTATRIMTGAPIPPGSDAVVPLEETSQVFNFISIKGNVNTGDHIRNRGEDISAGELVLATGTPLRPSEISLLASFGYAEVQVFKRPMVAILSTGDELVEPGENVGPAQIVNSNAYSMAAAVLEADGEPLLLGVAKDNSEDLREKLTEGLRADALITTAGVSMGDRDFVCEILQELGAELLFRTVDIKPGRPTAFALHHNGLAFLLPGNPVSAMVTFEEFVRPALLKMQGHQKVIKPFFKVKMAEMVKKKAGRVQFLRVSVSKDSGGLFAKSSGDQNTGILRTSVLSNGIAVLPAEKKLINVGDEVDVHLLSPFYGFDDGDR